uniref:Uncharacterized protein n=1 Tax=Rhizophora mucronata TaxID=61149 RepID=A0A2P2NZ23_RHIMU
MERVENNLNQAIQELKIKPTNPEFIQNQTEIK